MPDFSIYAPKSGENLLETRKSGINPPGVQKSDKNLLEKLSGENPLDTNYFLLKRPRGRITRVWAYSFSKII